MADPTADIEPLLDSIASELGVLLGRPERVAEDCARVRAALGSRPSAADLARLDRLLPLLRAQRGPAVAPLFALFEEIAPSCDDPWALLRPMLAAADASLARRALALATRLPGEGVLRARPGAVEDLAARVEDEGSAFADREGLAAIATLLRHGPEAGRGGADPVLVLFLEDRSPALRRLAARLLDLQHEPAPPEVSERLLGKEAHEFLQPYLGYTRATHLDLLRLAAAPGAAPVALESLRRAEAECGPELLREAVAAIGWPGLNLGLQVRRVVGVSLGGGYPLRVSPAEAAFLGRCKEARRTSESFLFVGHGGAAAAPREQADGEGTVARFRAYNLAHAEALADILDVAPLDRAKALRLLDRMDRIVGDFVALFSDATEEAAILPDVYRDLRGRIVAAIEAEPAGATLSPEACRLVQPFEDPPSVGAVRSLHGLKRYLHQKGLRLGFRLVERTRTTERSVTLLVASRDRRLRKVREIHYTDFEPDPGAAEAERIPPAVAAVADGLARQLLEGHESFPSVRVFCYGNEVHYFVSYANHPAFLRIDFAPPLQGGMIDLEYFGVSKYELADHPDLSLEAVRRFFRELEFDIRIGSTRIHARYDKERAATLSDLLEKVEALFRLLPYLMDLDWTIGGLRLPPEARRAATEAWAQRFALWGALPLGRILTSDRQGILTAVERGPAGEREIAWDGSGPYRDRFSRPLPAQALAPLLEAAESLGLDLPRPAGEADHLAAPIPLERRLLRPLRAAIARGEIVEGEAGLERAPADRFRREDEAEVFARLLGGGDDAIAACARLAQVLAPIERTLRFRTTGAVNGYPVQRAVLPLQGESAGLFVLRDAGGILRLALFTRGEVLHSRRAGSDRPWEFAGRTDAAEMARLLRSSNYVAADTGGTEAPDPVSIRAAFAHPSALPARRWHPGERVVAGLRASRGRAGGRAVLGTERRVPADLDGAILVAAQLRPQDNTFLYHAAGIVSTGGGILSHAGLLAAQFRKPALIVAGRWETSPSGAPALACESVACREEGRDVGGFRVTLLRDLREQTHPLREGDLLVLDADEGTLQILGQDPEALALHDGLRLFAESGRRLAAASSEAEILLLRGRRLRALHQVRKTASRLGDPALARWAVREIVTGEAGERDSLLAALLSNPRAGAAARDHLGEIAAGLARRRTALAERAAARIPTSASLYEILGLRRDLLEADRALHDAALCLSAAGLPASAAPVPDVDGPARRRLEEIRTSVRADLAAATAQPGSARPRHLVRQIERLDRVLGGEPSGALGPVRDRLVREDESARLAASRLVLGPVETGFALHQAVGWKAVNLAEIERLGGAGLVPPWFAVTHRAFELALDTPLEPGHRAAAEGSPATLREAIDAVLQRRDLDPARQSSHIRALWEAITPSPQLAAEVGAAYRALAAAEAAGGGRQEGALPPFVAVRSSAREEDAEAAARAGEFETFLFVRSEAEVLRHLRRAWSGLWTERAIHNRAVFGSPAGGIGGGVIVQRMIPSRIAGVLQTVNVAEGEFREMVVNCGLGLGEGIVSGTVGADHVVIRKEGDLERGPLHLRYVTVEKREQVVFNERAGGGTTRVETLYHQRLRPALEYGELGDLVRAAARLEAAYGYPLNLEFGFEGSRLWLLQARPVAGFLPWLREALERRPLAGAPSAATPPSPTEALR